MMSGKRMRFFVSLVFAAMWSVAVAGVPTEVSYQGKVEVAGKAWTGTGQFKFAIVNTSDTLTLWTNDGSTPTPPAAPTAAVPLNVQKGIFSVRLGDTSYAGMTQALAPSVFEQPDRWLRVWFDDGTHGFQRLDPDQKLASVPYSLVAETVPDESITGEKLTRESVWPEHEGRSNTVVAYFGTYVATKVTLGTIPAGKTFVITDISYSALDTANLSNQVQIEYELDAKTTILYAGYRGGSTNYEPAHATFRSGLPVPGGAILKIGPFAGVPDTPTGCTVAGYMFTP